MKKADDEQPSKEAKPDCKTTQQRYYTSHNENLPTQLSYHNVKLANFIQLQLTDLMDSIQQISGASYQNQLKECLSRSYNAFHEMQKLFADLGMTFLYQQIKKLISCYAIIFVFLSEKLQKGSSKQQQQKIQESFIPSKIDAFEKQIKQNIENIKMWKSQKQIKQYKRFRGVHLYNQSYARCVDYNIQQFRQLREKQNQMQITQQQKQHMRKLEEQKKFRQAIFEQEKQYNANLTVDGEDVAMFIHRQRKFKQVCKNMSLGDELQKIAVFFKQSHNQALQFLRKEKHLQTFLQLTQGFNSVVQDYQHIKQGQLVIMRQKVKQIFQLMRNQNIGLQLIIQEKEQQIKSLKQVIQNKKAMVQSIETQTYYNFDEEIKQLLKRSVQSEMMNTQLKSYINRVADENKKERGSFLMQITQKQANNKQLKDIVDDKLNYIAKVERKLKIIAEGNKNKGAKDPIQYFNSLTPEMKKLFCEQLREQGFLQNKDIIRKSGNKITTYKPSDSNHLHIVSGDRAATRSSEEDTTIAPIKQPKKRQSNLMRRSNFGGKGLELANQDRIQPNLYLSIPEYEYDLEATDSWGKGTKNVNFENTLKSKKMISIRNINDEDSTKQMKKIEKDKSVYSSSSNSISMGSNIKFQAYAFVDNKDNKVNVSNKLSHAQTKNESRAVDAVISNGAQNQKLGKIQIVTINEVNRESVYTQKINEQSQSNAESSRPYMLTNKMKMEQCISNTQNNNKYKQQIVSSQNHRQCSCECLCNQKMQYRQIQACQNKQARASCQMKLQGQTHYTNARIKTQGDINLSANKCKFLLSKQFNITFHNSIEVCSNINLSGSHSFGFNSPKFASNDSTKMQTYYINKDNSDRLSNQNSIISAKNGNKEHLNMKYTQKQKEYQNQNYNEKQKNKNKDNNKNINQSKIKDNTHLNMIKKQIVEQLKNKKEVIKNEEMRRKQNNVKNHSLDNSFHKEFNSNKNNIISSMIKKQLINSLSQTYGSSFKGAGYQHNKQNTQYANSNYQNYLSRTNHSLGKDGQYQMKMKLQEQLGNQQLILASRLSNTVQQFKEKALKVHEKRCGHNCKHLLRYIQIFMKLRNLEGKSKREIIKLHIENMNDKLGSYNQIELPYIKKI